MFSAYALLVLLVAVQGFVLQDEMCNYVYGKYCHKSTVEPSINDSTLTNKKLCSDNEVPSIINYTIMLNDNNSSVNGKMKVEFSPPNAECTYKVTLLYNPFGNNKSQCENELLKENDLNKMEVHTIETTICVYKQLDEPVVNNQSIILPCQDNIILWYRYIFTGCYVLRFYTSAGKYIQSKPKFLKTDYERQEVTRPLFHCTYDIIPEESRSTDVAVFTVGITIAPSISGLLLDFASVSQSNKNKHKACILYSQPPIYTWNINMVENSINGPNCSILPDNMTDISVMRNVKCNYNIDVNEDAGYCFTIRLIDERCYKQTLWNPHLDARWPCTWVQGCTKVPGSQRPVEYTDLVPDRRVTIGPSLLFPIIGIGISVVTILGFACFLHHVHKRHVNVPLHDHVNGHARSETTKLDDFATSYANDETDGEEYSNINKDIVLVYTKSSSPFMTFMTTFREMLSKHCNCSVHDWYAANEWNSVARVGASEWFNELLRKGCRIIWIDTAMTRALVPSKFNNNVYIKSKCKRQGQCEIDIGDFRDTEFPVVLDLAKRNIKDTGYQYHMHFIVRLKGFEATKESHDPFGDLSPYARYLIPEHFDQLCSHLSSSKSDITSQDVKTAQILLEQYLSAIEINFAE